MTTLGKPHGVFDLADSDHSVGSYFTKSDVKNILGVSESDLSTLDFKPIGGLEVVDEREIQKKWYKGEIRNAVSAKEVSLDEIVLLAIIKRALPGCEVEQQIRVKRFKLDLKITYNKQSIFIEFDGPSHFAVSRYGPPKHEPFRKKKVIEDETGIEVVNWGYWIQRCESNVKTLFDKNVKGFGVLWSTNILFGDFVFDNSANVIKTINDSFNLNYGEGFGYFYEANSMNRNNPEHPIIQQIISGKESVERVIPKGSDDRSIWLPNALNSFI